MAWNQKISKELIFILLLVFAFSCKTQRTDVILFENRLDGDSLALSEIKLEDTQTSIDTISIDFEELKLSELIPELKIDQPEITRKVDSSIINEYGDSLMVTEELYSVDTTLVLDSLLIFPIPFLEPYSIYSTIYSSVSSDSLMVHKELELDTANSADTVFSFPKPCMEPDSVVNKVSESIADSAYQNSSKYPQPLTKKDLKPLQDSISFILSALEKLESRPEIPTPYISHTVTSSVDTLVIIDTTAYNNVDKSILRDSLLITLHELHNTKAELNRQRALNKDKNNQKTTTFVPVPTGNSSKDTVFITEVHHYNNPNDSLLNSLSIIIDSLRSNMNNRKIVYDTINIFKQEGTSEINNANDAVQDEVKPPSNVTNVTNVTNITDNVDSEKLKESIKEKNNQINNLKDSLALLNRQLLLANNKQPDTVVVEKDKWHKDTVVVSEHTVDTLKLIVNPNDTLTYLAYYSINKVEARNLKSVLSKLKQVKISDIKRINLSGYTDVTGSFKYNKTLTDRRLAKMRNHLEDIGISEHKIFVQNFANRYASKSVNDSDRRIELEVLINKQ